MTENNGGSGGGRGPTTAGAGGGGGWGLLYKPGEGYWVRVMTAVLVAALFLSGAAWGYSSLEAISIPVKGWEFSLRAVSGTISAGQDIEIVRPSEEGPVTIGSAKVLTATSGLSGEARVRLDGVTMVDPKATPEDAKGQQIQVGPVGPSRVTGVVTFARAIPIFERLYLQSGAAGLLLVGGAILAYYIAGVRRSTVDFLIATDNEMKKVNWSTRREIMGSTYVVVGACLIIAAALFVTDYGFSTFFKAIDVLKSE